MNINKENYEEYLIDYLHGELDQNEASEVELFLKENKEASDEFKLLQLTVFKPDESIVFEPKANLLKNEVKPAFGISFKKMFATAAVLLGIIFGLYLFTKPKTDATLEVVKKENSQPKTTHPVIVAKHDSQQTTQPILPIPSSSYNQSAIIVPSKSKGQILVGKNQSKQKLRATLPERQHEMIATPQETKIEAPLNEQEEVVAQEEKHLQEIDEKPIIEPLPEGQTLENKIPEKGVLVLNEHKQPKLFRFLNQTTQLFHKAKQAKSTLENTEVTVMLGNFKIINLN